MQTLFLQSIFFLFVFWFLCKKALFYLICGGFHSIYWFRIVSLLFLIIFCHLEMPKDLWMAEEITKSRTLLLKYQMFSLHWENFCLSKKNSDLVPRYVLVIASFTSMNVCISFLVSIISLSCSLKGWNLCGSSKEE